MPLIRLVASELSPKKPAELKRVEPAPYIRRPERFKQQTRNKRHQRWVEIMTLHKNGYGLRQMSGTFPEMSTRPRKPSFLAP
ncbi:putative sT55 protein [Candidatus Erwinia dacicola]|uniref:ST55 protein n=1 Tax=Candidatus Erwinia dacicola TaxID=252393 RepID=A0A328TJZ0_9GAMM|nr:putative sT55 protein [Candidatus Erwinia dacicola]